jgi:hypothetical protein
VLLMRRGGGRRLIDCVLPAAGRGWLVGVVMPVTHGGYMLLRLLPAAAAAAAAAEAGPPPQGELLCGSTLITVAAGAPPQERLAASELRRAVYASTGALCELRATVSSSSSSSSNNTAAAPSLLLRRHPRLQVLAVGAEAAAIWREAVLSTTTTTTTTPRDGAFSSQASAWLGWGLPRAEGGHVVRSTVGGGVGGGAHVISLLGNSPQATLFAVYTFAERELGVQHLLSGDVFPPQPPLRGRPGRCTRSAPRFAEQDISMSPSFDVRGIQPFHDFSSGPDWWSGDDYKVVLTQLARQKLNFIGLHSYPMQEPLVWVGDPKHLDADGNVAAAGGWPTSWRTTLDSNWGSSGLNTS